MEKIKGKIEWLPEIPNEFPKNSGEYNIGIKIKGEFYNLDKPFDELNKLLGRIKIGYEVKLDVEKGKILNLEVLSEVVAESQNTKKNSDIVNISGKDFMTYKGLLRLAHEKKEDFSMVIYESFVSEDMKMAWCKVRLTTTMTTIDSETKEKTTEIAQTFDGFGSSTPENTGSMTQTHPVEMAHTRAKGRALRDYLNIGEAMAEELAKQ